MRKLYFPTTLDDLGIQETVDSWNAKTGDAGPVDFATVLMAIKGVQSAILEDRETLAGIVATPTSAAPSSSLALAGAGLVYSSDGSTISALTVGSGLAVVGGALTATASGVGGSGTQYNLSGWTAGTTLGNAPITYSGNNVTLAGTLTFPSGPAISTYNSTTIQVGSGSYIGTNLETSTISHYVDVRVINKAVNGWVTWATRNTAGAEAVMDLSSIGQISATKATLTLNDNNLILATPSASQTCTIGFNDGASTRKFSIFKSTDNNLYIYGSGAALSISQTTNDVSIQAVLWATRIWSSEFTTIFKSSGSTFFLLQHDGAAQGNIVDQVYQLRDSAANLDGYVLLRAQNTTWTSGAEVGMYEIQTMSAGTLGSSVTVLGRDTTFWGGMVIRRTTGVAHVVYRNTSAAATNNVVALNWHFNNSSAAETWFASIYVWSNVVTAGAHSSYMEFVLANASGGSATPLQLHWYGVVYNVGRYDYHGQHQLINKAADGWLTIFSKETAYTENRLKVNYVSELWAHTGNTSGAEQTLIKLGNFKDSVGVASYHLITEDASQQNLIVYSNRWQGGTTWRRGGSTGDKVLAKIFGSDGQVCALQLYQSDGTTVYFEVEATGVDIAAGLTYQVNGAPHYFAGSSTSRAPGTATYNGGISANTHADRSRFFARANNQTRELVTGHWEGKRASGVTAATGTTLTFANAYDNTPPYRMIPLAFWVDSEGNINWCKITRDETAITAYPAEDGATVYIYCLEPDANF